MKTKLMQPEEIELLDKVKNFETYEKLATFFNRSELAIRQQVYKLYAKRMKYIYSGYKKSKQSTF